VISLLFAMMFKWLPDTPIQWRDVWLGAILTAALFEGGKFLIGLYIGKQGLESTYGAAASIVVVLIWGSITPPSSSCWVPNSLRFMPSVMARSETRSQLIADQRTANLRTSVACMLPDPDANQPRAPIRYRTNKTR
jgi:hypothetical protein